MAESPSKKNKEVASNPKDQLDEMFDKADFNIHDQAFIDDEEDAIDRLLMGQGADSFIKPTSTAVSKSNDDDFDIDMLLMSAEKDTPKSIINANSNAEMKQSIDMLLDEFGDDSEGIAIDPPKKVELKTDVDADSLDEFASFDEDVITAQPPKIEDKSPVQSTDEQDDFDIFDIFEEDFSIAKPVETPVNKVDKPVSAVSEPISNDGLSSVSVSADPTQATDARTEMDFDEFDKSFEETFAEVREATQSETNLVSEPVIEIAPESTDIDEFDMSFDDAFAEVADANQVVVSSTNESFAENSEVQQTQISENDLEEDSFLIADFDITSDSDDYKTNTSNFDLGAIDTQISADSPGDKDIDELQDAFSELDDFLEQETQTNENFFDVETQDNVAIPSSTPQGTDNVAQQELLSQIGELWAAQDLLKQQFTASATAASLPEKVMTELEMLTNEQKSLRRLIEHNAPKKNPMLTYVALAIGGLGLLVGTGLFVLQLNRNAEFEALQQRSESLEKEVEILKNNGPVAQGSDVNTALADLNTQMAQVKEKLTGLDKVAQVDELHAAVAAIQVDLNGLLKKEVEQHASAKPIESVSNQNHLESPTANKLEIKKAEQAPIPNKESEKTAEKTTPERESKTVASVEKKTKPKLVQPVPSVAQESKQPGRWAANLVSFRQDWYAKRKAEEFAQRGIVVDVVPVELKGETWYRLRAGGFSDRTEANSFAAKAKKQLNLTSVWVTLE